MELMICENYNRSTAVAVTPFENIAVNVSRTCACADINGLLSAWRQVRC